MPELPGKPADSSSVPIPNGARLVPLEMKWLGAGFLSDIGSLLAPFEIYLGLSIQKINGAFRLLEAAIAFK